MADYAHRLLRFRHQAIRWATVSLGASAASAVVATAAGCSDRSDCSTTTSVTLCEAPPRSKDPASSSSSSRRSYTAEQVAQHDGRECDSSWVSFRGRVYDITDFIAEHPGGPLIAQAAGGSLEPWWAYWAYHTLLDRPTDFLNKYEIGLLSRDDDDGEDSIDLDEAREQLYADDPDRSQSMRDGQLVLTHRPWCSETVPSKLENLYTPIEAFYVRNHAPVPQCGPASEHTITFESPTINSHGRPATSLTQPITLQELENKYPLVTVPSVLQCAGNRAATLMEIAPTAFAGTPYAVIGTGLMGNAIWSGVRLADVLLDQNPWLREIEPEELRRYHVEFHGADDYRTSTPLSLILDDENRKDVALLCTRVNGEQLPPDHGYPVRVVMPGIAGCRNVKWVTQIRLLPPGKECDSGFQQYYYKDPHDRPIQTMPMQCFMTSKQRVGPGEWRVQGIAWGGGKGAGVSRIEVSADDGTTWQDVKDWTTPSTSSQTSAVKSSPPESASPSNIQAVSNAAESCLDHPWSWVQWQVLVKVDEDTQSPPTKAAAADGPTIVSRMFDGDGLQQPEQTWYKKGYLSNGWHRM